jgi:hypothetical protein
MIGATITVINFLYRKEVERCYREEGTGDSMLRNKIILGTQNPTLREGSDHFSSPAEWQNTVVHRMLQQIR